jgi:hypothetical protein
MAWSFTNIAAAKIDADGNLVVTLGATKGAASVTVTNPVTGETNRVAFDVVDAPAVNTVEFGEANLIEGDTTTYKLPVTFFDQYGEVIEVANGYDLITNFNVSVVPSVGLTVSTVSVTADSSDLTFTGATEGTYTLTLTNSSTGAQSSTTIEVSEARTPNELKVKTAPDASVEVGGTTNVEFEVYDQYGKLIPFASLTPYTIDVTYSAAGATASVTNTTLTSYTETITGNLAGTETITFTLNSAAPVAAIDAQEFEIEVIDALATLDVTVDKTEYTAGDTINVTIKAEAVLGTVHTDYNKTAVATISVGANTYIRTVTFVNGVATTTVPAKTAGATEAVNAVVNTKTDASAPTVKIVAAEASKFVLTGTTAAATLVVALQDNYENTIATFAGDKVAQITYPAGATKPAAADSEGNIVVTFTAGSGTITFGGNLVAGDYTVTCGGYTGTLTVK